MCIAAPMAYWPDHLFVNCTEVLPYLRLEQAVEQLLALRELGITNELAPQELDRKLDELNGCHVDVDQFVLLYFDPDLPTTRDICTSSGYGEFFPYPSTHKSMGLPSSAVVSVITFDVHDLRSEQQAIGK
jgi:hypothetical protein